MKIKEILTELIWHEIGPELRKELEHAGCQLQIADDYSDYSFTNVTADLAEKVKMKKQEALALINK